MAANMTVVTNLLNGRRVGRFANRKTLSSSEVMLPTGVTTCHLTLGEGETALDLGPVKVERQ